MAATDPGHSAPTLPSKTVTTALRSCERDTWPIALRSIPEKFEKYRDSQISAIRQILEHYENGAKIVVLDAPPGSGKTLIGETVRRLLKVSGLYICHTKSLQDQFATDFDYASVLKGRANYPTMRGDLFNGKTGAYRVTCADCTKTSSDLSDPECVWCDPVSECPYERAKRTLLRSELGVVNGSYFLTEANYVGRLSDAKFIIADECDTLESELLGFVGLDITERRVEEYGLGEPDKVTKEDSWMAWCSEAIARVKERLDSTDAPGPDSNIREVRQWKYTSDLYSNLHRLKLGLEQGGWVYTGKSGRVSFKPIEVLDVGKELLWRHGKRWLLMSGTVVSPSELVESLGGSDLYWESVSLGSSFDPSHRIVKVVQVADMSKKGLDEDRQKQINQQVEAIGKIVARHPGERMLVHTVSYDLANDLAVRMADIHNRDIRIFTYGSAAERDSVLRSFTTSESNVDGGSPITSILFAPSMDRGVDLPDDACRVIVVAKVPYPYLGDRQISARLYSGGKRGQTWYNVQTVRKIVQMTGRGVRHEEDYCTTYILDRNFYTGIWSKSRNLFPNWWIEGLDWRDKLED